MKKQIMYTITFVSALFIGNQAFGYTWTITNAAGYTINATVQTISCVNPGVSWTPIPSDGQSHSLTVGGWSAGCEGILTIDDYTKASALKNVSLASLSTETGANIIYCGYYATNDQTKSTFGSPSASAETFKNNTFGKTLPANLQVFLNNNSLIWSQSGGKCPAPAGN